MPKLLFVVGTRPEIIKVAPIILNLRELGYKDYRIINSGQHSELSKPYWEVFGISPDYDLQIIDPGQSLAQLTARGIQKFDDYLNKLSTDDKPKYIIAQGDTTTVMIAAMVAFYHQIKFAHIEAGLRTGDLYHPFPEEYNRKVVSASADVHFVPTKRAGDNLLNEGIKKDKLQFVGNTIVDAVDFVKNSPALNKTEFKDPELKKLIGQKKEIVLITCHRRENHDEIERIIQAVKELAESNSKLHFLWLLHANPKVKEPVEKSGLRNLPNVTITRPVDYFELLSIMDQTVKILTDSGGIQEEAPSYQIPVIVMREVTERQEAIEAGLGCLVGNNKEKIIEAFNSFKIKKEVKNPFGDGKSGMRIAKYLIEH